MADGLKMTFSMDTHFDTFDATVFDKACIALLDSGIEMRDMADIECPVDTGFLQSRNELSDTRSARKATITLTNDCDYVLPVVLGHHTRSGSWVDPQDFMTPSLHFGLDYLLNELEGLLG